jgi:hypothetical protein
VSQQRPLATVVVLCGDRELASWPLPVSARCHLSVVDDLARFQLAARRLGVAVRLRDVCGELRELLDLVGLADELGVEVRREPEGGEEVGVEEVVMPDDPVA